MPEEVVTTGGEQAAAPPDTALTQGIGEGKQPAPSGSGPDWSAHIPAELSKEKLWEPLKGKPLGDVLKGYAESQKMIGSTLRVPKEGAKPEEWNAFYEKLGRPQKPEGYEIQVAEGEVEPNVLDALKTLAWENGLNPKQTQAMVDLVASMEALKTEKSEDALLNDLSTLKKEWGPAFQRKIEVAKRATLEFAGPDTIRMLNETGMGNNPSMIRFMARVGEYLAEDGTISGDIRGSGSKEEAMERIKSIQSDMNHPYWNDGPGHKEAVEEMKRLSKLAYT